MSTERKILSGLLIGVNNLSGRRIGQTSEELGQQRRLFSKELKPWLELDYGYSWCQQSLSANDSG